MIAPLRPTQQRKPAQRRSFLEARRAIAAALLRVQEAPVVPSTITGWRAWAIAAWMSSVALIYVVTLVWSRVS